MLRNVTKIYVLGFSIDKHDRQDVENVSDYLMNEGDLGKLGWQQCFDIHQFQDLLNESTSDQEIDMDEYWWKFVYVMYE